MNGTLDNIKNITIYTHDGCSKCNIIKVKLQQLNIQYEERDVNELDRDIINQYGFTYTPITYYTDENNNPKYLSFSEFNKIINNIKEA